MKKSFRFILSLIATIVLVGCASSGDYLRENDKKVINNRVEKKIQYKSIKDIPQFNSMRNFVAPGFLFSLSHPSDEKLKGRFRVDFNGILRLPYNVRVNVKRKTFDEVRNEVMNSYKKFFQKGVRNVSFKLIYRHYYVEVRGYVNKTGRYLVTRKDSLDKVLDKAGGLKGDLKKDFFSASIKQANKSYTISLNQYFENNVFGNSFTWVGGDTIFVNELSEISDDNVPMISILGGVSKPGKILYKPGANIYYYLGKSGGTIQNVDYKHAYIIRKTDKGLKKVHFNLTEMDTIPAINANDTIMLSAEKSTAMDRFLSRAAQIGSILTSLAVLLIAL